ncbi:hypothetical protein JNW91_21160 [Micromonospora sp. STR1_7]|uniref:Uncharacterized protein n=1 Tax=Micromonospora parastrephiae TaxID=2806101 RepID=A0ABS1XY99_9ACTN|nr:hypothetical protein [Micromonospora parastrephiae]MBM0234129.1 hypothetical protein [Micromonospora parastrephiae]
MASRSGVLGRPMSRVRSSLSVVSSPRAIERSSAATNPAVPASSPAFSRVEASSAADRSRWTTAVPVTSVTASASSSKVNAVPPSS